jgi:hypothetical protein
LSHASLGNWNSHVCLRFFYFMPNIPIGYSVNFPQISHLNILDGPITDVHQQAPIPRWTRDHQGSVPLCTALPYLPFTTSSISPSSSR